MKKEDINNNIEITFNLMSGNNFKIICNKSSNIQDIILGIDIELIKILNITDLPFYELIHADKKININVLINNYYIMHDIIYIIIIPTYTKLIYPFSEYIEYPMFPHYLEHTHVLEPRFYLDDCIYEIQLYPVETNYNNALLLNIDKNIKWKYGCRCSRPEILICRHDLILEFDFYEKKIITHSAYIRKCLSKTICCNIFKQPIIELCQECKRDLFTTILKIYAVMHYSRRYRVQIVKNETSEIFLNRFKDLIAFCFSILFHE